MPPIASIIVPTRARPDYLEVALASIAPQARAAGAEVIVVDDGATAATRAVAERHGARYVAHERPLGPNAARNTGIEAAAGDTLVLVDDDVEAPAGWLAALLAGLGANPGHDVVGGPIRARLEGARWRACGREGPPITFLDLGGADRDAEFVWSANMAIRRAALERVGPFDPALEIYGDEEEWQRRHLAAGGRTRYIAAAGLGPSDGFTSYKAFVGDPPRTRWGDYGAAVTDGNSIYIASEYIAQTCTLSQYLSGAIGSCGGTRTSLANWATRITKLNL